MNIVQITPGAGGMYCGNCFRDNALVAELRRQGHHTLMIPLYLPMTLEESDQSAGTPIFFSGINVYLQQKSSWFQRLPKWLHQKLASPRLLQWAAGRAARTRPEDVGETTLSMLRGEAGRQVRELDELVAWLRTQQPRPDVICLSNALLIGLARRLRQALGIPVVSMLQGEDYFLDSLPPALREQAWKLLTERARDIDLFLPPSRYFADLMIRRLQLNPAKVRILPNAINLAGFPTENHPAPPQPPVIGFFARMCQDKGLHLLVDAYLELRRRNCVPGLRLKVGGGCGPTDEPFVAAQKAKLQSAGFLTDVEFHPNLTREEKIRFLQSLTVFSVPALYGEAFGLYLIEALAAGAPVVQPNVAAFPEIIAATRGGLIADPTAASLADALEKILTQPALARSLGHTGRQSVFQDFSMPTMAANFTRILSTVAQTN